MGLDENALDEKALDENWAHGGAQEARGIHEETYPKNKV